MNPHSHYGHDHSPWEVPWPSSAPSVLDQLHLAYELIAQALGRAPQLHDCHLDQALLLLVISMKRARRSRRLRTAPPWDPQRQFNFR